MHEEEEAGTEAGEAAKWIQEARNQRAACT